jgi:hypothetical protein
MPQTLSCPAVLFRRCFVSVLGLLFGADSAVVDLDLLFGADSAVIDLR